MATATVTRTKLIETARDLFLVQGYHATGVAQILKESGLNSGSLYHFFPTKEDLLVAVLEWYRDNIYEGLLQPVFERVDDPVERIFGVLDGYRQLLLILNFNYGCPIGNLALEVSNTHVRARQLIQQNFDNWIDAVRQCVLDASGRFPPNVDHEQLATMTLAVMEGAVMMAKTDRNFEKFDQSIHQLREFYDLLQKSGSNW